eukprot:2424238-Prorocentrum_lima.AAC.1
MTSSLVGSEMCIRDRLCTAISRSRCPKRETPSYIESSQCASPRPASRSNCLLYTSDAADDM